MRMLWYGRTSFGSPSSNVADPFQSLCVTLQSGFRESHLKSCWVEMGHKKGGGKGGPFSSP